MYGAIIWLCGSNYLRIYVVNNNGLNYLSYVFT